LSPLKRRPPNTDADMELTEQLQHEERRNARWRGEAFFQHNSDKDCYLEATSDPNDSDSDAPREWVIEESIVVHTGGEANKSHD
jgi:hypothetical protein